MHGIITEIKHIAGIVYVQKINLVQIFVTGIYIYNPGHSATYKYEGTTQYKIRIQTQIQNKIQVDPTMRENPQ